MANLCAIVLLVRFFFFSMCFDLFLLELVRILRACGIPSVHLFSIKCLFLCYLVVFVARSGKRRHRVRKCMAVVEAFPNILLLFFISPTIIYTWGQDSSDSMGTQHLSPDKDTTSYIVVHRPILSWRWPARRQVHPSHQKSSMTRSCTVWASMCGDSWTRQKTSET